MNVTFSNQIEYFEYEADSPVNVDFSAIDRFRMETILDSNPKRYFKTLQNIFQLNDTILVFGNIGRHPFILTYFLDLCFQTDASIQCKWDTQSPYQDGRQSSTIIQLEPDFNETIIKPHYAKHLIIFSSHAALQILNENYKIVTCHLGPCTKPKFTTLQANTTLIPDILHIERKNIPCEPSIVKVDVSDSKTLNESYLKILNAFELLKNHVIVLKVPKNISSLKSILNISKSHVQQFEPMEFNLEQIYIAPFNNLDECR